MYMSNNGRVKVVIESCILLIALVIVSCLYTAELSKRRNLLNYLDKKDEEAYKDLVKKLGLRK